MKTKILLLQMLFLSAIAFSQTNIGFESGNTSGWVCKSGYYGAYGPGYSACPPIGTCPRFSSIYNGGAVTSGVINAPIGNAGDRHTIVTGSGTDLNSGGLVPVVAPGGGNYSFRLGNSITGRVTGLYGDTTYPQAEALRLTFTVNANNAGFTYRYAFFVQDPGHPYESQPSFEVVVLDANDVVIPCGRYFVVGGNYPACVNTAGFQNGTNGFTFKNWTDVAVDLTSYIGQSISIEFRTSDCDPAGGGSSTTCSGGICTYCLNGNCCTYSSPQTTCTPPAGGCNYAAGTHSSYAYIDAYSSPLTIATPTFCAGVGSIQICAPAGYENYSWPAGQPGLTGSGTSQCVTIKNPVAGTTYTVNIISATGCSTSVSTTIINPAPTVSISGNTSFCSGSSSTLTASGGITYSWSNGQTTATIIVTPTVTTTYSVVVTDSTGCSIDTVSVHNFPIPSPIPICLVTVDSTSTKNEIIWEKPASALPIDSFKIYRQISSQYKQIGSVAYSALSKFIDATNGVNPNLTSYKYAISVLDTCSNESALSAFHQTIHLQISPAVPSGFNLFWNDYQGFYFNQYYILRDGNNTGNWQKIDSVSFGITTYTDPNPPTDSARYLVEAPNPNGCVVSIKNPGPLSENINSARSNSTVNPNAAGIHEYKNELLVTVYPNPTSGIFNLKMNTWVQKAQLRIYTMYGECIHEQISKSANEQIDLSSQPCGVYFLKINSEKGNAVKKIVINK